MLDPQAKALIDLVIENFEMSEQVSVERRILTSTRHRAVLGSPRKDGCVGNHPSGPSMADCSS